MIALALLMTVAGDSQESSTTARCDYDRKAMLALGWREFDQDMTGGWRKLANAGCDLEAAELISTWLRNSDQRRSTLIWHEGQLRANAGQYAQAISLFEQARKPAEQDARFGWNFYVDGSIAFLRGDRPALVAARAKLSAVPRPNSLSMIGPDGKPRTVEWPMNLKVLDRLLQCWGRPYRVAYTCRATKQAPS